MAEVTAGHQKQHKKHLKQWSKKGDILKFVKNVTQKYVSSSESGSEV